jgi:hypothetical protein
MRRNALRIRLFSFFSRADVPAMDAPALRVKAA